MTVGGVVAILAGEEGGSETAQLGGRERLAIRNGGRMRQGESHLVRQVVRLEVVGQNLIGNVTQDHGEVGIFAQFGRNCRDLDGLVGREDFETDICQSRLDGTDSRNLLKGEFHPFREEQPLGCSLSTGELAQELLIEHTDMGTMLVNEHQTRLDDRDDVLVTELDEVGADWFRSRSTPLAYRRSRG